MHIEKITSPSHAELKLLSDAFDDYLQQQLPGIAPESDDQPFVFYAYENEDMVGGISGNLYWQGLSIDTLWVAKEMRGKGIGKALVLQAELFAKEHNAVIAYLKTVDAKHFYEKLGYSSYGVLEDRPPGTLLYHMKKRLD